MAPKTFHSVTVKTKNMEYGGDFTESELMEILSKDIDCNIEEIVIEGNRIKKSEIKKIIVERDEYEDV